MLRSRLLWQFFGGYVLVVLVCSSIVGFAVAKWSTDNSLGEIRRSLRVDAVLLGDLARPQLDGSVDAGFQRRIEDLGRETGTRFTVISRDGIVLADSVESPKSMDNHARRPEILAAAASGFGSLTRFSRTIGRDMMYAALRVEDASAKPIGFVRSALDLSVVDDRLSVVRGLVLRGAGIAALVALLLGIFVARRFTSRLGSMTEVAGAMAAGDYTRRVRPGSRDEIGRLGTAFNAMAEQLQNRIDTITKDRNTLQAILRSMVEGVIAVDRHEIVLHMNAVAGDILEVEPREVIGKRIWETARVNEVARSLAASLAGERVYRTQARVIRGGEECLLDISASPLADADENLTGAVVVFHDVTEMRRLELVRREFVVNASHELKTPITAIRGFLDTLVSDPDMPSETRQKFLERAASQSERLSLLVTDLLRLSRFEAGDAAESQQRLDLRAVAGRAVGELRTVAAAKRVELRTRDDDAEIPVMGEAATLGLIVDNLVDNAIKYSRTGGHVEVRTSVRENRALLEVIDDGIGIAPEDQDRIFERFYRVDKARSREVGGTGLGLAIAKHACGILGGRLSVESELGVGSVFRVSLPLAE